MKPIQVISNFLEQQNNTPNKFKTDFEIRSNFTRYLTEQGIKIGSEQYLKIFKRIDVVLSEYKSIRSKADLNRFKLINGLISLDEMNYSKKETIRTERTNQDLYYFIDKSCLVVNLNIKRVHTR